MDGRRTHSTNDVQIRAADMRDAPQIAACLEAAFAPYRDLYPPAAYADTVPGSDGILRRIASKHVLVAVAGDQVAGTIAAAINEHGEGHLRGMAVLPQWHGSGIASQLLVAIEDYLRAQGCCRVTLNTTLPLQRAIRFYESHGYRHSGVTGDFYGMPLYEYAKNL
jgi:GNAT superfamily N-acetyltransferase